MQIIFGSSQHEKVVHLNQRVVFAWLLQYSCERRVKGVKGEITVGLNKIRTEEKSPLIVKISSRVSFERSENVRIYKECVRR